MRRGLSFSVYAAAASLSTLLITHSTNAKVVPYLEPGFSFRYEGDERTVNLPVTEQCQTIRLRWGRGTRAKGKAPIAPYFLQVFSSNASSPFVIPAGSGPVFDWQVPFAPQTQYQICMYDNFGISGGCQAMRTMIPSSREDVSCPSITPLPPLSASTSLDDTSRPITQVPVISECNDFSVSPTTGSPPFTLTIAPSRHPPVNISSSSRDAISWTVALPEGFPFFASLTSADGLFWSQGPFFVDGAGVSPECLAPGAIPKNTFTYSTIGGSVGGFVLGSLLSIVAMIFLARRRRRKEASTTPHPPIISKPTLIPELTAHYRPPPPPPEEQTIQYPPPPVFSQPHSHPTTPERGNFLERDPFASVPPSRAEDSSSDTTSIQPFTEMSSPTSSHFPLDVKRRISQATSTAPSLGPARTASLRSYTTYASTSYNGSAYASSHNSMTPLMPSASMSARSSRASRLGRAPTYTRRAPPSHLSADPLLDGDSMIGPGDADMPPQYMRSPAEEEQTVAGGALV